MYNYNLAETREQDEEVGRKFYASQTLILKKPTFQHQLQVLTEIWQHGLECAEPF